MAHLALARDLQPRSSGGSQGAVVPRDMSHQHQPSPLLLLPLLLACTTATPRVLAFIPPIRDLFKPFSQAEVSLDEYMGVMLDLGWAEPGRDLEIAQLGRSGIALLVIVDIARLACALK